ncbi:kelch-like protein 10 [Dermacentor andersoni]|uniref:kelch-like protein 10 n=1 Tax=Dermacentor andersoni TaxID=34620 RepID=UPI002415E861|nr:kelch-like protein 1 [Dermacentor andersoni]
MPVITVWKNSAQFQDLTPEELRAILEHDRLHAPDEVEDTFGAVLKWISADVDERKACLAKFLPLVRFARSSVPDFRESRHSPTSTGRRRQPEGDGRDPQDAHPAVHGGGRSCRRRPVPEAVAPASPAKGHSLPFRRLDSGREQQPVHVQLPRRQVARQERAVRCVQGQIYAMGGFDGHRRTNTVERYDVETNQWSMVASMNDVRSDASAAVAAGRIYIVGGFTGRAVLDTLECYDPSTNAWTRVATMASPSSGLKVVARRDALYIIGGYNGTARLSSMEQLGVNGARSSELPSMPHAKSNFAAVMLEGCIYTVGVFDASWA